MTSEGTIFKYKDGFILLEDLESRYSDGLIAPNDHIRIYENGGKQTGYCRVETLIQIYGSRFPFRRVPRPFEHDPLTAYSSDEEASIVLTRPHSSLDLSSYPPKEGGGIEAPRPSKMGGVFGGAARTTLSILDELPAPRGSRSVQAQSSPSRVPPNDPWPVEYPVNQYITPEQFMNQPAQYEGCSIPYPAHFGQHPTAQTFPMNSNRDQPISHYQGQPVIQMTQRGPGSAPYPAHFDQPVQNSPITGPMGYDPVRLGLESQNLNPNFEYRDYPLYNVANESEEDQITGRDVFNEIEKLKSMLSLGRWSTKEMDYFYFLNRKNYRKEQVSSVAICRLCNHTPFGGKLFFKHLFNEEHIRKLSDFQISLKSFRFWKDHIEKCKGIYKGSTTTIPPTVPSPTDEPTALPAITARCGSVRTIERASEDSEMSQDNNTPTGLPAAVVSIVGARSLKMAQKHSICKNTFPYIPLLESRNGNEKMKQSDIKLLTGMREYAKMGRNKWRCGRYFLPYLIEQEANEMKQTMVDRPSFDLAQQTLCEDHLQTLRGVTQNDINFWVNVLKLDVTNRDCGNLKFFKIIAFRNDRPVPLIDFKIESQLLEKSCRSAKLRTLKSTYRSIPREKFNEYRSIMFGTSGSLLHENVACCACSLPENSFKTQADLVDHVFNSDSHTNYLIVFGFSEKACQWWHKFFDDVMNPAPVKHAKSEEPPSTISSVPILEERPRASTVPPIIPVAAVPPVMKATGNNPRVALLDLPVVGAQRSNQKDYIMSIRSMVTSLDHVGKEAARKRVVNWKCDYCKINSLRFNTELEAFNHIVSQKHLEKMKFTGPKDDLSYWISWAINISRGEDIQRMLGIEITLEKEEETLKVGNVSRVPMLDKFPLMNHSCKQTLLYTELGKQHRKFQKCSQFELDKARQMRVNWRCSYCTERPIMMANMLYAFNHIMSKQHWENMKFTAALDDLQYWKDWANGIFSDTIEETPEPVERVKKVKKRDEIEKNVPRVPLLDPMVEGEESVSKERFDKVLNECLILYKADDKKMEIAKSHRKTVICSFCSTLSKQTQASTENDAFLHIVKSVHRENMGFAASESDLQYWKKWVMNLNLETRKGTNNPRFPLLDVPRSQNNLMPKRDYKTSYTSISSRFLVLEPSNETNQKVDCTCYHCPGNPKMVTIYDVMKHVFNGNHDTNICYQANPLDFEYFEDLIKTMKAPQVQTTVTSSVVVNPIATTVPEALTIDKTPTISPNEISVTNPLVPTTETKPKVATIEPIMDRPPPISIVLPTRSTTTPTVLKYCQLPLFQSYPLGRSNLSTDTECIGPTNAEVDFVTKLKWDGTLGPPKLFFENSQFTTCRVCNIDMSRWTMHQCALHVFGVSHSEKLEQNLIRVYVEDYHWWFRSLNASKLFIIPKMDSTLTICRMGRLDRAFYGGASFTKISPFESGLIKNIDENKLQVHCHTLLMKFGGCVYCNKWLLKPMDVIHHYLSEQHFQKIRDQRRLWQEDIDPIMQYVTISQKEKTSCAVM